MARPRRREALAVHLSARSKTTVQSTPPTSATPISSDKKEDDKEEGSSLAAAWAALPQEHRAGLGVVTAATAALNFSFGAIVPVLPQYALGLGLGSSGVGLVLAAPAFARVCLNSPFGRLADSRGRRPLMIFGEAAAACGVALTGMAPTATTMVAARLLVGAGGSAANAGSTAYVGDVTGLPKVQRHRGLPGEALSGRWTLGPTTTIPVGFPIERGTKITIFM